MKKILLIAITGLFILSLAGCLDDHDHNNGSHGHDEPTNTHDSMK